MFIAGAHNNEGLFGTLSAFDFLMKNGFQRESFLDKKRFNSNLKKKMFRARSKHEKLDFSLHFRKPLQRNQPKTISLK